MQRQKLDTNPSLIRLSSGTAIVLGLQQGKLDARPTTAYLMTYKDGKCTANCCFCAQARGSKGSAELLSRVTWPTFPIKEALSVLGNEFKQNKIRRVCIQALNYPEVFAHLEAIVREIKKEATIPVSVSCQPLEKANIERMANAGVDRLGVPLDAASETIFNRVKGKGGSYSWNNQFRMLTEALAVFGKGNVSTHLIVGLGETELEAVHIIQRCVDMSVSPGLFAFTPIRGTGLEKNSPPKLESYRRMQLARFLIVKGIAQVDGMCFDKDGKIVNFGMPKEVLEDVVLSGEPFLTSGCPDCNRPFYNEKPSGPIYNYPRKLTYRELRAVRLQFTSSF
ncbi:MAG: radical SAM protein [Candidatus Bathyarchaeia archaeon]